MTEIESKQAQALTDFFTGQTPAEVHRRSKILTDGVGALLKQLTRECADALSRGAGDHANLVVSRIAEVDGLARVLAMHPMFAAAHSTPREKKLYEVLLVSLGLREDRRDNKQSEETADPLVELIAKLMGVPLKDIKLTQL